MNFRFEDMAGYESFYTAPYFVRILNVKVPRFRNGQIVGFDMYDLTQRKLYFGYTRA